MSLEKEVKYDKIEVYGDYKAIQLREATVVKEDGVEISRTFHRKVLHPSGCKRNEDGTYIHTSTDISEEPQEVQDVCNAVWTDAAKEAWKVQQESVLSARYEE